MPRVSDEDFYMGSEMSEKGIDFILLADDDEDDVFLFHQVVGQLKQVPHVVVATDGVHALEILSGLSRPSLTFLDINMPRMSGLECFSRMRGQVETSGVPVIFLSTSNNQEFIDEAERLGARGYIRKPLSFVEFEQVISEALSVDWNNSKAPFFVHQ
ncbi:response regulator [Dyadobacter bucti]|uniref:response regulator n=1 Tax=Dyadobacter bucti TaxID=2572203 RepID=UPI001109C447|nr:response regulator [Dyadobacter bucti]